MQVILKPDPGNPQELYLKSLKALGIDTQKHDVRFVEDNWENPALGAWGLGWEVWLDGKLQVLNKGRKHLVMPWPRIADRTKVCKYQRSATSHAPSSARWWLAVHEQLCW